MYIQKIYSVEFEDFYRASKWADPLEVDPFAAIEPFKQRARQ